MLSGIVVYYAQEEKLNTLAEVYKYYSIMHANMICTIYAAIYVLRRVTFHGWNLQVA